MFSEAASVSFFLG